MFDLLLSEHKLSLLMASFFIFFTVRQLFIKKIMYILLYHMSLFLALFINLLGGGGVLNDSYKRLDKFVLLEKSNQLEQAKNVRKESTSMLQIDLQEFHTSDEFRKHIKINHERLDKVEAIFIGWILVLLTEISMMLTQLVTYYKHSSK